VLGKSERKRKNRNPVTPRTSHSSPRTKGKKGRKKKGGGFVQGGGEKKKNQKHEGFFNVGGLLGGRGGGGGREDGKKATSKVGDPKKKGLDLEHLKSLGVKKKKQQGNPHTRPDERTTDMDIVGVKRKGLDIRPKGGTETQSGCQTKDNKKKKTARKKYCREKRT